MWEDIGRRVDKWRDHLAGNKPESQGHKQSDTTILKALVGSRAHGLHREDSDWDWRGIFVQPTSEILSLGYAPKSVQWLEGKEDFTNYEVGHFLMLATKANPSVLELLVSPNYETSSDDNLLWADKICNLFPYLYNPKDAFNAFTGYSVNQRKKLLDDKDGRSLKYALAYVRTLYNLIDLLETGTFSLKIEEGERFDELCEIRDGMFNVGYIINLANALTEKAKKLLPFAENRQDLARVNAFLLEIRKAFWEY